MGSKKLSPTYRYFIVQNYEALIKLGGSGTNDEIHDTVINLMDLSDDKIGEAPLGSPSQTELEYQLAWARTYMKNYGIINNSKRGVWFLNLKYKKEVKIDPKEIISHSVRMNGEAREETKRVPENPENGDKEDDEIEYPDEVKPWKRHLSDVLIHMNPYDFESLTQLLLRECGFTQVSVTKKTGDGGVDGFGKLKINGIFSFNVAFQCKRYSGIVGAPEIRDFRGSLTTNIEKGLFITTGRFSKQAMEEANASGKQQIDLIDGEDLINKLAEHSLGVREVKTYEVDDAFFKEFKKD
jgi:restriction system protein